MVVQPEIKPVCSVAGLQTGYGNKLCYTKMARVVGVVCAVILPMKRKLLRLAVRLLASLLASPGRLHTHTHLAARRTAARRRPRSACSAPSL